MANTTNGLPHPVGTDKVVDGDDAIRALAEAVDTRVLPFGYARARATQAAAHGASAWGLMFLDVLADQHGQQPWTLEAGSRRMKVTKAGVYSLTAVVSMSGGSAAVGVAFSTDGATWDRVASVPIGTVNFTNSVSTTRYIAANTYVAVMMYQATTLNNVADAANTPTYLAIQALGGTAGILP